MSFNARSSWFGSAPLQICVDPTFLSADVDVSLPGQGEELQELVDEIGLSKGKAPYYIEVYIQKNGRKSALWEHTEKLWPRIFGRAMDVRSEIIQPVLDELSAGGTNRDYLDEIRMRLGI